jgi:uncharacterized protein
MTGLPAIALLFAAGLTAGVINVIAGGGSFITLPILIFLGLPAGIANGTNRVGILTQNIGAVWSFRRAGVLDPRSLALTAGPATLGAALGTWGALLVGDRDFERILAVLMVLISLASIWHTRARNEGSGASLDRSHPRALLLALAFFGVGIYGGFIQAGVGFLMLGATSFGGQDLVRGNAIKVFTALCFTVLSLAIFAANGRVDWAVGLALGAGNFAGGLTGARLTVLKGHRWLRNAVTVAILIFALKLWLG